MGWHPILTGHATCELGMIPEWLEFYPVFRTDHWMSSKIEDQSHIETLINFAEYHQASIEQVKAGKATFQQFINSRFYIRPELNAWNIVPVKQTFFTRITHRIKEVYDNDGLAKLLLHICINAVAKDDVALHEFLDAIIQTVFRFETGLFNFFV